MKRATSVEFVAKI